VALAGPPVLAGVVKVVSECGGHAARPRCAGLLYSNQVPELLPDFVPDSVPPREFVRSVAPSFG
jgi:hypothetical protein